MDWPYYLFPKLKRLRAKLKLRFFFVSLLCFVGCSIFFGENIQTFPGPFTKAFANDKPKGKPNISPVMIPEQPVMHANPSTSGGRILQELIFRSSPTPEKKHKRSTMDGLSKMMGEARWS